MAVSAKGSGPGALNTEAASNDNVTTFEGTASEDALAEALALVKSVDGDVGRLTDAELAFVVRAYLEADDDECDGLPEYAVSAFDAACEEDTRRLAARYEAVKAACSSGAAGGPHDPELMARVFRYSSITEHILEQSRARMVGPWAALFMTLTHAALLTPWWVRLPAVVSGKDASLNLITALVGESGGGKSATSGGGAIIHWETDPLTPEGAALHEGEGQSPRRILQPDTVGSGEAVSSMFVELRRLEGDPDPVTGKPGPKVPVLVRTRRAAWVDFAEVDHFLGLVRKEASTLSAELRKFWDGATIGVHTKTMERRSTVEAFTYRGVVTVNVQPTRAGVLLDGEDGGLPQRFVWAATNDPGATANAPAKPTTLDLRLPSWRTPAEGRDGLPVAYIDVDQRVTAQIRADREKVLRGLEGALVGLDAHRNLVQLKLAAAVAVLHGLTRVTPKEWALAGDLMTHSDRVREDIRRSLAAAQVQFNANRGAADAQREMGKALARDTAIRRAADSIADWMAKRSGPVTAGDIAASAKSTSNRRVFRDEALLLLQDEGRVRRIDGGGKTATRYALIPDGGS